MFPIRVLLPLWENWCGGSGGPVHYKVCMESYNHGARRNSGNGGNGGNDRKIIIIIIDYVGDGGNDIQRLDSTVERYFLHRRPERLTTWPREDTQSLHQNMGFSHYQPQNTSYVNL